MSEAGTFSLLIHKILKSGATISMTTAPCEGTFCTLRMFNAMLEAELDRID